MRYFIILLLIANISFGQKGDGLLRASISQATPQLTSYSVDDITNLDGHDAEEASNGIMIVSSSDLELNYGGSAAKVGVLFNNLNIPPGAVITNAYIEFHPERTEATSPPSLTIVGEISANPAIFTTSTNNISNRTTTTASVAWNSIGTWTSGVINANSTTPDLSSVLQEIVDSGGYDATDNIVIIFEPGGGTSRRRGDDFSITTEAPHLFVDYDN